MRRAEPLVQRVLHPLYDPSDRKGHNEYDASVAADTTDAVADPSGPGLGTDEPNGSYGAGRCWGAPTVIVMTPC